MADAERLSLALDALAENAVRHTGPSDEITVSVIGDDGNRSARIMIEDSGSGIAAADLPRIFDRFASFGDPGARGTGLGLALVQAVARGHGGDVAVSSTLGEGSRFELVLPNRAPADGATPDGVTGDLPRRGLAGTSGQALQDGTADGRPREWTDTDQQRAIRNQRGDCEVQG
jgi:two-component system, OmpR family, sensor kinase